MFIIGVPYSNCEYTSVLPCTSEPEAVAIACGAKLGGSECLVFMQDCGLLSALNTFIGLSDTYKIKLNVTIKFVETPEHHKKTCEMARIVYDTFRSNRKDIQ